MAIITEHKYKPTGKNYRKASIEIIPNPGLSNTYLLVEDLHGQRIEHAKVYSDVRVNPEEGLPCHLLKRDRLHMAEPNGTLFATSPLGPPVEDVNELLFLETVRLGGLLPLTSVEKIKPAKT